MTAKSFRYCFKTIPVAYAGGSLCAEWAETAPDNGLCAFVWRRPRCGDGGAGGHGGNSADNKKVKRKRRSVKLIEQN